MNATNISIAVREANAKRPYVLVNHLMAKHVPSDPAQTLLYFESLGKKTALETKGKMALVIGFAETATAIGTAVASQIPNCVYTHTTRETYPIDKHIVSFSEEHSHATQHTLFSSLPRRDFQNFECVVFVDDEISTARTIRNFVRELQEKHIISQNARIIAASLLSGGTSGENLDAISAERVFLSETPKIDFNERIARFSKFLPDVDFKRENIIPKIIEISGFADPRLGVLMSDYDKACLEFAKKTAASIRHDNKNVLVMGTEEFMYPALVAGRMIAREAKSVKVHATTRSPIMPCREDGYPLFSRATLRSFYDDERVTFIYNLQKYDAVIVLTDSAYTGIGVSDLLCALKHAGNDVTIVRWKK
ncbi:hypothetical protein AGMMS50276_21630 [Synergistales bacterium]|nr:hypothetical protein AGMMS50276_21630 [Synergistales bacterium]